MRKGLTVFPIIIILAMFLASCAPLNPATLLEKVLPDAEEVTPAPVPETTEPEPEETAVNTLEEQRETDSASQNKAVEELEDVYVRIYEQVNPSVVNIQVLRIVSAGESPILEFFDRQDIPQDRLQSGLGSGFVWDKQGHIVTNNHVIANADNITVTFPDGASMKAVVVGADPNSDLAVIQVDADAGLLVPVVVGESARVKVGELAVAIGNPFGLEGSLTVGVVSAIGRSLPVNNAGILPGSSSFVIPDIIQTDAPINPGNSGGVLVDTEGAVIGVTTAIESTDGSNSGIGFAVPSDQVKKVVPALIKEGKYEYSYLGISGQTLTSEIAREMGLEEDQRGVLVGEVTKDGPADKAGLVGSSRAATIDGRPVQVGGDVITKIDDQGLVRFEDLVSYLARETSVGQDVELTILRDNKEQVVEARLEARPAPKPLAGVLPGLPEGEPGGDAPLAPELPGAPQAASVWLGITGSDLSADLARALELDLSTRGIEIITVAEGSPADKAGLQGRSPARAGDIITEFDGNGVNGMDQLRGRISEKAAGDSVMLTVIRDNQEITVEVTLAEKE